MTNETVFLKMSEMWALVRLGPRAKMYQGFPWNEKLHLET